MLQSLYPAIGSKVSFIRQNMLGAPEQGNGVVLGFALDPNKRLMAHINTGTEKVNVDVKSLNPSGEYIETFAFAIKKIKALGEEGNAHVAEIVAKYNKMVDDEFALILGYPIVIEDINVVNVIQEDTEVV